MRKSSKKIPTREIDSLAKHEKKKIKSKNTLKAPTWILHGKILKAPEMHNDHKKKLTW